ncbi:MAG TPA: TatD family hydrolase [Frankiaceae bacterium]|nr:TatD family hydrolase [Frankiaceae bacterium]
MLFDARLLALPLRDADLDDLRWFGVAGALVPMEETAAAAGAAPLLAAWERLAGPVVRRLRRAGLHGVAAIGIPPRRIPYRGLEALLHELPELLSRPGVAAIGEIGLEEGGPREERVLERQLELAAGLRLPVVARAPWRRREAITRRLLAVLKASELEPARVLIQGVDARTVRMVRACGHAAGLLVTGGEALDEAVAVVRTQGPEGLVLSSGAGEAGGDLLALPRAAGRLRQAGLSAAVVRRVCGGNAVKLLGIVLPTHPA